MSDDPDDGGIGYCSVCVKSRRFFSLGEALGHYLAAHPQSDILRETLSGVSIRVECSGCGEPFVTGVDIGCDEAGDGAVITAAAYCEACEGDDPIREIIVQTVSPHAVIEQDVTND